MNQGEQADTNGLCSPTAGKTHLVAEHEATMICNFGQNDKLDRPCARDCPDQCGPGPNYDYPDPRFDHGVRYEFQTYTNDRTRMTQLWRLRRI
jgi:hypothetical protein